MLHIKEKLCFFQAIHTAIMNKEITFEYNYDKYSFVMEMSNNQYMIKIVNTYLNYTLLSAEMVLEGESLQVSCVRFYDDEFLFNRTKKPIYSYDCSKESIFITTDFYEQLINECKFNEMSCAV